jgi:hypothetical protein
MNLEEEIAKELSNEVAKSIDFEILTDLLKICGWSVVQLESLLSRKRSVDIIEWCDTNAKGRYKHLGCTFVFENQGDAVNFALKWV